MNGRRASARGAVARTVPILVREIFTIIRRVNEEQGMSILLVEQNAKVALETAHYGYFWKSAGSS